MGKKTHKKVTPKPPHKVVEVPPPEYTHLGEIDDTWIEGVVRMPATVEEHMNSPERYNGEWDKRKLSRVRKVASELARRKAEALSLYEPLDHIIPFHACEAPERIVRGSNRSGKTLSAAVECARVLCGLDPYGKTPKENGRCFIVGKDGKHNSEVLYRKLFRHGAFKIIKDNQTGFWRTWRPWLKEDMDREKETKLAPPLVPERLVHDIAWENKKEQVPNVVRMKNGWEARFFSSLGKPPQGSDVDFVWFDEEIVDSEWYPEVVARGLVDREGSFVWSATAQKGGAALFDLCKEAEDQRELENPRIVEFFAHINKNTHFTDKQRSNFEDRLSDEQRRIRIEGEFAFTSFQVYPEYDDRHLVDYFEVPADWTRYMVVDPGRQVCAVLFAAVPPPTHKMDGRVVLYDELYIRNCTAETFAAEVQRKARDQTFQAFLIDYRGGRVRAIGSGHMVEREYAEALKEAGISSEDTGSSFLWGDDDVKGGVEVVRGWLSSRKGEPRLAVMKDKLMNFDYEMIRYHYKRDKHVLTDEPVHKNNHLMDCLRYLCVYDPKWRKKKQGKRLNEALAAMKKKRERAAAKNGPGYIGLG